MITGNYTLKANPTIWRTLATEKVYLVCDTTSGPVTIFLPSIASVGVATNVKIFVVDGTNNASVNNITIVPFAGDKIDGLTGTDYKIKTNNDSVEIQISEVTQDKKWVAFEGSANTSGGGGGVTLVSVTHAELIDKITNNQIVVGQKYLLTDFRLKQDIPETGQDVGSPYGTVWNNEGWADLSDYTTRNYGDWAANTPSPYTPPSLIGAEMIMKDYLNNKYYKVMFSAWTSGGAGGGFAYTRQEILSPTTFGPVVNFTHTNFGSEVDVIDTGLSITRAVTQGIYNPQSETVYTDSGYSYNAAQVTGPIEPLILEGVATNKVSENALSTIYSQDEINYSATSTLQGADRGLIYSRKDTLLNIKTAYDWRNVKFRRWESSPGSGVYSITTDNGGAFLDFYTFENLSEPIKSANVELAPIYNGADVMLNNTVFSDETKNSSLKGLNRNTFLCVVRNSTIECDDFRDNLFNGGNFVDNKISGRNFINNNAANDFFGNSVNNVDFIYNQIGSGFYGNQIDGYFAFNTIAYSFQGNRVGLNFQGNNIDGACYENQFFCIMQNNSIGTQMNHNTIQGNQFLQNVIGNNFQNNFINIRISLNFCNIATNFKENNVDVAMSQFITTLNDFTNNKITVSNQFQSNAFGFTAINNVIDCHTFSGNNFDVQFFGNNINCYQFQGNSAKAVFQNNTINMPGSSFTNNTLGMNFQSNNVFANIFTANNLSGSDFSLNVIGPEGFNGNVCAKDSFFVSNKIVSFYNNTINGPNFKNNVIESANCNGNQFQGSTNFNSILGQNDFTSNEIGGGFNNNTISCPFSSNSFDNNAKFNNFTNACEVFNSNVVGPSMTKNTFRGKSQALNYTAATHVYQSYSTDVVERVDGELRLSYVNNADALVIVNALS